MAYIMAYMTETSFFVKCFEDIKKGTFDLKDLLLMGVIFDHDHY